MDFFVCSKVLYPNTGGLRYDKEYDRRTSIKTHYDVRIAFIIRKYILANL